MDWGSVFCPSPFTHAAVKCELWTKVVFAHRSRKKKKTKTALLNWHSEAKTVGSQANYSIVQFFYVDCFFISFIIWRYFVIVALSASRLFKWSKGFFLCMWHEHASTRTGRDNRMYALIFFPEQMIKAIQRFTQVLWTDGCSSEQVSKLFERLDVFNKQVTKSIEWLDVFIEQVSKSFEWMDVFTKWVSKSFEWLDIFNKRVSKSFERLDVSTKRVIKPFERMQIFLNGWTRSFERIQISFKRLSNGF